MSRNKNLKKNRPIKTKSDDKVDGIIYPSKEVITAQHWLPDFKEVWDKEGDLRARLIVEIESADGNNELVWEDAVVMDPKKPDPVKVIGANWIHADVHGIMTEETFFQDLAKCAAEFGDMIATDQNPFQPVRIYKDAENAYGVGYFDWRGDDYPFDVRTLCQFGQWEFETDKKEVVNAAGFRFWLGTLVLPTEADADVHVGQDMAGQIFND